MQNPRLKCGVMVLIASFAVGLAAAQEPGLGWHTRLGDAQAAAKSAGRPILAFFTDSANCPWCAKLMADVFDSPQFAQWARATVVLLDVDLPSGKEQDPAIKSQNTALKEKFGVRSYPVVIFMSAEQKEIGRIPGYPKPAKSADEARDKWLKQAQSILGR